MSEKPSYDVLEIRVRDLEQAQLKTREHERELFEIKEKYLHLAGNIPGMIYRGKADWSTEIIMNSEKVCGYTVDEIKTQKINWVDLIHRDDKPRVFEEAAEMMKTRLNITQEYRILVKNGNTMWVSDHKTPFFNTDGSFAGVDGIVYDITDRKQAGDALQKREEIYRSILESMKDDIYICSPEFRIEYMNPRLIDRIGYDATGEFCHQAIYGRDKKCSWCVFNKVKKGEHIEYELKNPKNARHYSVVNSPIFHKDGTVSKLTIFHDITEIKEMGKKIQQSQKLEAIGILAGGIAHDFNNILSPILGHTDLLLMDTPDNSPSQNSLKEINTAALRAKSLVKQILAFSRQESSESILMKVQPIVKEALKLIRSTIPATIGIVQDISPDCGLIKADPTQIHQIVMNLSTNAYHAMKETGGKLTVSLSGINLGEPSLVMPGMIPGPYVCLKISDTGMGMDKAIMEKIFDPFFTTKELGIGTGMGLSVVHGIVTRMGGLIRADSEPGIGSQFHVYFPVVRRFSGDQPRQPQEPIPTGSERILLVDDEQMIITMEKQMLERLGYHVTARSSSIEALNVFRANPDKFDLVITDMAMPNMAGDQLSIELTKIQPGIPVVLCTGFSETITEEMASSLGIKGFLLKPIVMKDLAEKIREVLD